MVPRITTRHFENDRMRGRMTALVRELADRDVERRLATVPDGGRRLEAVLEQHPARHLYRASLRLRLPRQSLIAWEEGEDGEGVVREAFAELSRQIDRYIARVKGTPEWRRPARRERLRALKAAMPERSEEERTLYVELVRDHLGGLERFIRRELAFLRAQGELESDYPTPDDILDAALLRGFRAFHDRPAHMEIEAWLRHLAIEVTAEEVARARGLPEDALSLEERVVEVPITGFIDDEFYEFYQPDEVLKVEDEIPVPEETPEEALGDLELRRSLVRLLTLLPTLWRRAVTMAWLDGLPPEQVGAALHCSPDEIRRVLEHADAFLQAKLGDAGYSLPEEASVADYFPEEVSLPAEEEVETRVHRVLEELLEAEEAGGEPPPEEAPGP